MKTIRDKNNKCYSNIEALEQVRSNILHILCVDDELISLQNKTLAYLDCAIMSYKELLDTYRRK